MNHIQIAELLDRYWEGETTIVEERRLKEYFTSGAVDERFRDVAPLFQALNEAHTVKAPDHLGKSISPAPMRVVGFNAWKQYMAAAVLTGIIAVGGWMYFNAGPNTTSVAANTPAVQEPATPAPVVTPAAAPVAKLAVAVATTAKPKSVKRHQPKEDPISEAEALQAVEEIKAALALVSRKLNKGKNDATKNLNKVEMVDHFFKQG